MLNGQAKKHPPVMLFFILLAVSLMIGGEPDAAEVPGGLSREVVANFAGTMQSSPPAPEHVAISREIIAHFVGTMKETKPVQIYAPISREIVANFVGTMKETQQLRTPPSVAPQRIKSPLGQKAPEMLRRK